MPFISCRRRELRMEEYGLEGSLEEEDRSFRQELTAVGSPVLSKYFPKDELPLSVMARVGARVKGFGASKSYATRRLICTLHP